MASARPALAIAYPNRLLAVLLDRATTAAIADYPRKVTR